MPDTNTHGKICYIELPSADPSQSAAFYASIFGWSIRTRGDGSTAFDDAHGNVSGAFSPDKRPVDDPGYILYIMVDDIRDTIAAIEAQGCKIERPLGYHPTELAAHFRDPGGNLLGLYQEPA